MTTYRDDEMTSHGSEPTEPDDATVEQVEPVPGLGCIPVEVEGPVSTRELPAKGNGSRRYTITTTAPQKVLGRDPRRKRAVVQVYDATGASHGIYHGTTINEVRPVDATTPPAFAARLAATGPVGAPVTSHLLEVTSQDELWCIADTAACDVSVIAEQWAD